jgi:hypothetical protein
MDKKLNIQKMVLINGSHYEKKIGGLPVEISTSIALTIPRDESLKPRPM